MEKEINSSNSSEDTAEKALNQNGTATDNHNNSSVTKRKLVSTLRFLVQMVLIIIVFIISSFYFNFSIFSCFTHLILFLF